MKNILKKVYIVLASVCLIGTAACNRFLEIKPQAQVPTDVALTRSANVEATLFSAYNALMGGDFLGGRVQLYSELMSDNPDFTGVQVGSTDFTGQVITRQTNTFNVDVDGLWSAGYRAIARANNVIGAIDGNLITDGIATDGQKRQWKAEALFIRAIAHFELVRLFSQPFSKNNGSEPGVPLRIKSLIQDDKIGRGTVAGVYTQVVADLREAITNLPATNGNRASSWAVRGYLAKVLFNQLSYAPALTEANAIVNSGIFSLSGTALTPFRNIGNTNAIGGVLFQNVTGFNPFGGFRSASRTYALQTGTNSLVAIINASVNDSRNSPTMLTTLDGRTYANKWDANNLNVPLVRYTDILLIAAEAAAIGGNTAVAQQRYDAIRGFYVTGYTATLLTGTALLDAIRTERRIEMMQEGDRFHDLRRQRASIIGITGLRPTVTFDHPSTLLKIPLSELNGNNAIQQNPD